jgi:hypothetical protein
LFALVALLGVIYTGLSPRACSDFDIGTIEAMPKLVDGLLAKGFNLITVSEMIANATKTATTPRQRRGLNEAEDRDGHPLVDVSSTNLRGSGTES